MTIEEHISAPDALLILTDALMPPCVLFAGGIRAFVQPSAVAYCNLSVKFLPLF